MHDGGNTEHGDGGHGGGARPDAVHDPTDFEAGLTWVDLLDISPDQTVLLIDPGHRRAEVALRSKSDHVDVAGPQEIGRPGTDNTYDVICLDDLRIGEDDLGVLSHRLHAGGQLVAVLDNSLSPLRALDRLNHRPVGESGRRSLSRWSDEVTRSGLEVEQVFGLLRSSTNPATAFDLRAPSSVEAVVTATLNHVGGKRGALLRRLPSLGPGNVARLVPAWLIVARRGSACVDPLRVTGKVANRDSDEVKLIRGEPPQAIDRLHDAEQPQVEAEALLELERVGFDHSPRVLGTPDPLSSSVTWMDGEPLEVSALTEEELVAWVGRAARVLGRMQHLTRKPDGSVLVHGDLWLGNLLVSGDRITGVIDWTFARRGEPTIDQAFLVDSLKDHAAVTPSVLERISRARDEGLAESHSA